MKTLNYYWRLVATAFSFSIFGIGGLLIPFIAVPALYFYPSSKVEKQRKARRLVHLIFRAFVRMMRALGILTWSTQDLHRLNRDGLLVLANHPTLLDVVFLVSFIPNAVCIVKSGLLKNPAMRGFITMAGYITNDNGEALIADSARSLADGGSLVIFPEGTRTREGASLSFQRGASNIAVRTPVSVTPIRITCDPATLSKQHKWYNIPDRPFHMSFVVEEDISITPFLDGSATRSTRQLTKYLEHYFSEDSSEHEYSGTRT